MTPERWGKLESVFQRAIEMPPHERAEFIEAEAGADREFAREALGLLAAHESEHRLLDANRGMSAGMRLGPYEIDRLLGSGGMGSVYLARRADRQFEKQVAIKVVAPGFAATVEAERFTRERRILAGLEHPNIARLLDAGVTAHGQPYLVMEYVDGVPIDEWCRTRSKSIRERIILFRKLCAAASYAHRHLVVHRDVKPGNVLVTADGEPKLLDFGIAKLLDAPDNRTAAPFQVFSLAYASPEQLRGQPVSTAADVYSLGVLLYLLLTGASPVEADPSDPAAFARAVEEKSALKPSLVARRMDEAVRIPQDLDVVLLKAIEKDPARRYASVDEFDADLDRFLDGRPILARPATLSYRMSKFVRRRTAAVTLSAIATAAVLGLTAATVWQAGVARIEARRAQEINRFLRAMLGAANPNADGRTVTVASVLDRAARAIEVELQSDPSVRAGVQATIGSTYRGLGMLPEAEHHLRAALELDRALHGPDSEATAERLLEIAAILQDRGDLSGAERTAREVLGIERRRKNTEGTARALNTLGAILLVKGDLKGSEQAHFDAFHGLERLGRLHTPLGAEVTADLAVALGTQGRVAEAERYHRQAVEIVRRAYPPGHPMVARAVTALAAFVADNHLGDPEPLFREAISIRRSTLGDDHPDLAWSLYNYAFYLCDQKTYSQARQLVDEILSHAGKSLAEDNPMVAAALFLKGRILSEQGHPAEALVPLEECLRLRRRTLPEGHWLIASTESLLGYCLAASGQDTEGRRLMRSGYERLLALFGPDHIRTTQARDRVNAAERR